MRERLLFKLPWRRAATPAQPQPGSPDWLLLQLVRAHERLGACFSRLDDLLQQESADLDRDEAVRRELAEAKRKRALAVQHVLEFLSGRADDADRRKLAELESITQRTLLASAEHLRRWTPIAVSGSWREYGAAQRAIRSHWLDVIAAEQAILYPLLKRHSAAGVARR